MVKKKLVLTMLLAFAATLLLSLVAFAVQKPNFVGSWTMDRGRSFGLPGNMTQTLTVTQKDDQIEVETKLIQPGNERVQKDLYILDGKEHEFAPPVPANAPPNTPAPKGKRTATWLPAGNGITVTDVTTAETPKGPTTTQIVRKLTISAQGELIIDMYVDNPNASYEAKRIFKRS
ncbi:MAG TPA: hypothetical protein VJT15_16785 [Pyrinomonadaceae bacterium]|nr:hypothetical protein [Pyrinomonadaceae bacterium]